MIGYQDSRCYPTICNVSHMIPVRMNAERPIAIKNCPKRPIRDVPPWTRSSLTRSILSDNGKVLFSVNFRTDKFGLATEKKKQAKPIQVEKKPSSNPD